MITPRGRGKRDAESSDERPTCSMTAMSVPAQATTLGTLLRGFCMQHITKTSNAIAVQQDLVVANLQRASTALAEAKTIQQTKKIIDVAAAAEIYAKRQQLGEENIAIAHSIKLEALRKLGEMLKETPRAKGKILRGTKMEPRENQPQTLKELGLDKKTSAVAQRLAELPQDAFEQVREGHETIAKAIAAVRDTKDLEKVTAKPAPVAKDETQALLEHIEELTVTTKELLAENISMGAVIDADDKMEALHKQIKTLTATIVSISAMRDMYMSECAQLKRQVAMLNKKLKKLEA